MVQAAGRRRLLRRLLRGLLLLLLLLRHLMRLRGRQVAEGGGGVEAACHRLPPLFLHGGGRGRPLVPASGLAATAGAGAAALSPGRGEHATEGWRPEEVICRGGEQVSG